MNLRQFAKGKHCQVRIGGVCNHDPTTTVLAHIRKGGVAGIGQKPPDLFAVHACSDCHNVMDGRAKGPDWITGEALDSIVLDALGRTLALVTEQVDISRKL